MLDDIKKILSSVAPVIGTAIGGPLGGAALSTLSNVLFGNSNATEEQVLSALKNATPEQLVAIKKAEFYYKAEIERLKVEEQKIYIDDVKNARQKNIEMTKLGKKDNTVNYLSYIIVIGYFFLVVYFGIFGVTESSKDIISSGFELLKLMAVGVAGYHFGSSAGSKEKNSLFFK